MAVPKRKTSKARKRKRRSHMALEMPGTTLCARCGSNKPPHTVCESCGYYRGRDILALDA